MKLAINLFNKAQITLGYEWDTSGSLVFAKAFLAFLDRPRHPHLSLFANQPRLEPHFTAARGRYDQFRWWFPAVETKDAIRVVKSAADELLRDCLGGLEPIDLHALEEQGWFLCGANFRILKRWLRLLLRRSREINFDEQAVSMLCSHMLRRLFRPTAALTIPGDHLVRLAAVRQTEAGEVEVRSLARFPHGCGAPGPDGEPILLHPPGWYILPEEVPVEATMARVVPMERLDAVAQELHECLARYPSRQKGADDDFPDIPDWMMSLGTFYGSELVDLAFMVVVEASGQGPGPGPAAERSTRSRGGSRRGHRGGARQHGGRRDRDPRQPSPRHQEPAQLPRRGQGRRPGPQSGGDRQGGC